MSENERERVNERGANNGENERSYEMGKESMNSKTCAHAYLCRIIYVCA